jgi:AcrR family transcriptional regulator
MPTTSGTDRSAGRLDADSRRESLLDVARDLLNQWGVKGVTMGTVAEQADVTRALVYKHFTNREDLLAALYRREAAALDRSLRRRVTGAEDGFEPKLRAFVQGVLGAVETHEHTFSALRAYGQNPEFRREQRRWDRTTVRYFTSMATAEFGLDRALAGPAVSILLSGIDSLIADARAKPGPRRRQLLEDVYVAMALASVRRLAEDPPT